MKPQIALDTRMVQHTGIGTYLRGLIQGFETLGPQNWNLSQVHFKDRIYSLGEQMAYANRLGEFQLWHAPHYNIPYYKRKTKLVVTVHDLIHWIFRKDFFSPAQAFYAQTFFRRVAKTADHIIAVSHNTARDLNHYFDVDPKKISVIYESVEKDHARLPESQLQDLRNRYGLPETFFLYVGSLKRHKNVQTLLRVFRNLRKNKQLQSGLVIIGGKDKKYPAALCELETLQSGDGIWYFPKMERSELIRFYNASLALVHLSLYEGFGLTPLESMACETPVIASNVSSIPEIVGEAAMLVDPLDETQISKALLQMEQDASLRNRLRLKGLERLKKFSWQKTAEQTAEVYQKVLAS